MNLVAIDAARRIIGINNKMKNKDSFTLLYIAVIICWIMLDSKLATWQELTVTILSAVIANIFAWLSNNTILHDETGGVA